MSDKDPPWAALWSSLESSRLAALDCCGLFWLSHGSRTCYSSPRLRRGFSRPQVMKKFPNKDTKLMVGCSNGKAYSIDVSAAPPAHGACAAAAAVAACLGAPL